MINPHVYHCFEVFETFWILAFLRQQMCEPLLSSFLVWSIEIYWNLLILHILRANHFVSLVASHGIASHRQGREALPRCGRLRNPWWKRGAQEVTREVTGGHWRSLEVTGQRNLEKSCQEILLDLAIRQARKSVIDGFDLLLFSIPSSLRYNGGLCKHLIWYWNSLQQGCSFQCRHLVVM